VNVFQHERRVRPTGSHLSVRDITDDVAEAVQDSGIEDGIACVYSTHTTCWVRVNEWESGLLEDYAVLLSRLVPNGGEQYSAHDDREQRTRALGDEGREAANGHAHCISLLLGSAGESIPVRAGELCLGTWQRILFLELDREREELDRERERRWIVQVFGRQL